MMMMMVVVDDDGTDDDDDVEDGQDFIHQSFHNNVSNTKMMMRMDVNVVMMFMIVERVMMMRIMIIVEGIMMMMMTMIVERVFCPGGGGNCPTQIRIRPRMERRRGDDPNFENLDF